MTDRSSYPSEQADKFLVRLPEGMRDRIRKVAKLNGRSMNAEIVATLDEAYPDERSVELMVEYLRDLAHAYADKDQRTASTLREIYEVINGIRAVLANEEDEDSE